MDNLTRLQVGFKRELIKEVKAFVVDAQYFRKVGFFLYLRWEPCTRAMCFDFRVTVSLFAVMHLLVYH